MPSPRSVAAAPGPVDLAADRAGGPRGRGHRGQRGLGGQGELPQLRDAARSRPGRITTVRGRIAPTPAARSASRSPAATSPARRGSAWAPGARSGSPATPGALDFTIFNVRVVLDGTASGPCLIADADTKKLERRRGRRVLPRRALRQAGHHRPGAIQPPGGATTWTNVPATLTAEGSPAFAGFYEPGRGAGPGHLQLLDGRRLGLCRGSVREARQRGHGAARRHPARRPSPPAPRSSSASRARAS